MKWLTPGEAVDVLVSRGHKRHAARKVIAREIGDDTAWDDAKGFTGMLWRLPDQPDGSISPRHGDAWWRVPTLDWAKGQLRYPGEPHRRGGPYWEWTRIEISAAELDRRFPPGAPPSASLRRRPPKQRDAAKVALQNMYPKGIPTSEKLEAVTEAVNARTKLKISRDTVKRAMDDLSHAK